MKFFEDIKRISNAAVTEISQGILICCLITNAVILVRHMGWTIGCYISTLSACAVFLGWLAWVVYKILARKDIKEMQGKSRNIFEWINALLFILLGVIYIFPQTSGLWMIWIAWFCLVCTTGYWLRNR